MLLKSDILLISPLATLKVQVVDWFLHWLTAFKSRLWMQTYFGEPQEWLLYIKRLFSVSLYLTMMWKVKAVHNIQTIKEECYSNPPITTNGSKKMFRCSKCDTYFIQLFHIYTSSVHNIVTDTVNKKKWLPSIFVVYSWNISYVKMRMYVKIFYIYIYIVLYSFCNKKTSYCPSWTCCI